MKADILNTQGKKTGSIELPEMFSEAYRPDVIKKAFLAYTSENYQPKGADPLAGQKTTATGWQTGSGKSRMPRVKAGPFRASRNAKGNRYRSKGRSFRMAGQYRIAPGTVGGREAHPPKSQKIIVRLINNREMNLAIASAISATADSERVKARGHMFDEKIALPIVVSNEIEVIKKAKEALATLVILGVGKDLTRCANSKIKGGRGKMRGRRYRRPVGPLIVISDEKGIELAARNISGVDVATVEDLNIEALAPGANAGRLTIWTKAAVEQMAAQKTAGAKEVAE